MHTRQPTRFTNYGRHEALMNSDQPRQRAKRTFKQQARARHGRNAITEYEAQALATREKTARLRALRLAKEAQAQNEDAATRPTKGNKKRRTEIRRDK